MPVPGPIMTMGASSSAGTLNEAFGWTYTATCPSARSARYVEATPSYRPPCRTDATVRWARFGWASGLDEIEY